jgi:proteasome assembly chaperone (PAC2) family protein
MSEAFRLTENPSAGAMVMIAGWRQWADAGNISSGLPPYLIHALGARKIGELDSSGFYIFQIPGTHHFLRPEVRLADGFPEGITRPSNEIYYAEREGRGIVIFVGEEPHLDAERYAAVFMQIVRALNVERVVALGGVFASVPFDRARELHAAYSLRELRAELEPYAITFSEYEGGVTVSTYLLAVAAELGIPFVSLYGFVPSYDFSELSPQLEGLRIEEDHRAWLEISRRISHMFSLGLDLSDLERHSGELTVAMAERIDELDGRSPEAGIRAYLARVSEGFSERPFMQYGSLWEDELGDILKGMDG